MKLLIHICCGPCFLYPLEEMVKEHEVIGFFYNPNIHPFGEYSKRLEVVQDYLRQREIPLVVGDYAIKSYFRAVAFHEEKPERCQHCYHLRLARTVEFAEKNGFKAFSTTLLVSPYQEHEAIKKTGEAIAKTTGVDFIYRDFRSGYREGMARSKELEMYRQKYCGCLFSERESIEKREARCKGREI